MPCERRALGVGVAEVDVVEARCPRVIGRGTGAGCAGGDHPRLQLHELVVVGEEEVVLVEAGQAAAGRSAGLLRPVWKAW